MLIQTSDSMLRCDSSAECFCNWATKFKSSVHSPFASSCQWHSCFASQDESRDPLGTTVPLARPFLLVQISCPLCLCSPPNPRPNQLLVLRVFTEVSAKLAGLSAYTKEKGTFEKKTSQDF